jgi:hypothetical protein
LAADGRGVKRRCCSAATTEAPTGAQASARTFAARLWKRRGAVPGSSVPRGTRRGQPLPRKHACGPFGAATPGRPSSTVLCPRSGKIRPRALRSQAACDDEKHEDQGGPTRRRGRRERGACNHACDHFFFAEWMHGIVRCSWGSRALTTGPAYSRPNNPYAAINP